MALSDLPERATVVGSIEINLFLNDGGTISTAYGYDGLSPEAVIGYMTVVQDRIREERSFQWDTCPGCGQPWSEHGDEEDDEEGDD